MLLVAERCGAPIDPDEFWRRFSADLALNEEVAGACYMSHLLDVARAYGIARHLDVTHDVERAKMALAVKNVRGVLMTTERGVPRSDGKPQLSFSHIMVVHRIEGDKDHGFSVLCDSPHDQSTAPERFVFRGEWIPSMMAAFAILVA